MSDVVISYNGSDIAEMSETGTKTLNTQGTYLPSNVQIRYTSPMDNANFIPGIESETYEVLFGGEFTVTTATDAEHEHPYANTGIVGYLNKRYAYRVTFDGVQYSMPPQIFATEYNDSWMTYTYVGDISLYHKPMDGLLNEQQNVPFLITEHFISGNYWLDVYTPVAGEHTFLIEGVNASYERIPSDLIYGNVFLPFQCMTDSNERHAFSVGSNRFITTNSRPPMYAFGYDNIVSGQGACAIGVLNEASGQAAMSFGYGNKAKGNFSRAFGRRNIASGNQSFADGQMTIASGAISRAEGDGCRAAAVGSHAEGGGTYADASQIYTHVGGVNNAVSTATGKTVTVTRYDENGTVFSTSTRTLGKYAEVIGNGDSDQARSNARTLDWNGNEAIAGSLTLGLGTQGEITLSPAQLATVLASLLPAVSASDNGKVLQVVNGAWAAATIPSANGVNF